MIKGFIVKKQGMTQRFSENGKLEAATVCHAAPCYVVGQRTIDNNGYSALQIAAGEKKKVNKPMQGQLKKAGLDFFPAITREVAWEGKDQDLPELGTKIKFDQLFEVGSKVDVVGTSKGRGFTGVVKRWNFRTQPRTHGQKQHWRSPGAIGSQTPGKVIKGKKMPGHYGNERVTVKNLKVLDIDEKENKLYLKGAVPGPDSNWLVVIPLEGKKENEK